MLCSVGMPKETGLIILECKGLVKWPSHSLFVLSWSETFFKAPVQLLVQLHLLPVTPFCFCSAKLTFFSCELFHSSSSGQQLLLLFSLFLSLYFLSSHWPLKGEGREGGRRRRKKKKEPCISTGTEWVREKKKERKEIATPRALLLLLLRNKRIYVEEEEKVKLGSLKTIKAPYMIAIGSVAM